MFKDFMKDKITLVNSEGEKVREAIPAFVQKGKITTNVTDLPINRGDFVLRELPNGMVEEYEIVDPHFTNYGQMSHWSLEVRRTNQPPASPQTIINNIQGNNSRVLINSTDSSTNIISGMSSSQLQDFVSQVKDHISSLPDEIRHEIVTALAVVEEESGKSEPDSSKLFSALISIKTACEGAAGNLVAAGIVGLASQFIQ